MNKLKSALKPEIKQLIVQCYHKAVQPKRTALWFFTKRVKNGWMPNQEEDHQQGAEHHDHSFSCTKSNLKRMQIVELWNGMHPESKREFFNMAEYDEARYKEQRTLWVAELASLLAKHGNEPEKIAQFVPNLERTQREFLDSIEKYRTNYEKMIQAGSTRTLYKGIIERIELNVPNLTAEKLISDIPKDYRHILSRPRRPPIPFVMYTFENKDELMDLRKRKHPEMPFLKLAGMVWSKLSPDKRLKYEERYNKLKIEYDQAMEKFKKDNLDSNDDYLGQALREKRLFTSALRKKLREFSIVPLNVRNAFNFFVMKNEGTHLTELTKIWRELPNEMKQEYIRYVEEDMLRYQNEKMAYKEIMDELEQLFDERKSTKTVRIQ